MPSSATSAQDHEGRAVGEAVEAVEEGDHEAAPIPVAHLVHGGAAELDDVGDPGPVEEWYLPFGRRGQCVGHHGERDPFSRPIRVHFS
jgi:hypothetical protein